MAQPSLATVQFGTGTQTYHYHRPHRATDDVAKNSWERGIAVQHRANGESMPYLDSNGETIPIKHWAQTERRKFEDAGLA